MNRTFDSGKRMQLFCIPFAGGSKNSFRKLACYIDKDIDVILLEYPGHGRRTKEMFCESIDELKNDIEGQIRNNRNLDIPYAILGYSLGSVVTYELLCHIYSLREFSDFPKHIFLCAVESLLNYKPKINFEIMQQEEIKNRLISMGGIDERVWKDARFMEMFLRPIEKDYKVLSKYKFLRGRKRPRVNCSIFYAENDTPYEAIKDWDKLFDGNVDFYKFGVNHFFINTEAEKMAIKINNVLLNK